MRINEVIAPQPTPTPTTFWHVTPHTRLKSIMSEGIRPSRRRQWTNHVGGRLGQTGMVYLFANFDSAIQLAARLEWGLMSEKRKITQVDILEIQGNFPVEPDPNIEAQLDGTGKWWMTPKLISPTAIKRVIPLTLEMKREFIARRDGRLPVAQQLGQDAQGENQPEDQPQAPQAPIGHQ
jgi:hypothetical protein